HALDPAPERMDQIETTEGVALYRNPSALSRAFFAKHIEVVASQDDAIAKMREPGFDPATTIAVEDPDHSPAFETSQHSDVPAGVTSNENQPALATTRLIESRRNTVQVGTESETGGILFLSDTYYPGWQVDVDGAPTRIYKADVAFRAVSVPPGSHV